MRAYYNEYDKIAAAWLRELIANKLIADGDVDDRSITDVTADDLAGYTQHHFFAGIGGWSYALRLAGVPDDYPVWTASLPCQPFSLAGKQLGKADERHLLPHFLELVRQCKPDLLFGEQVTGAIRHGWLDDLQTTMEAEGYAVGHCVLGAHSVGAFHQRQRLYWVANSKGERGRRRVALGERRDQESGRSGAPCGMGDTELHGHPADPIRRSLGQGESESWALEFKGPSSIWCDPTWISCRDGKQRPIKSGVEPLAYGVPARMVRLRGYGNAIVPQVAAEFIGAFFDIQK